MHISRLLNIPLNACMLQYQIIVLAALLQSAARAGANLQENRFHARLPNLNLMVFTDPLARLAAQPYRQQHHTPRDVPTFPDLVLATVKSCRAGWPSPTYSGQDSGYNLAEADTEASAAMLMSATSVCRADLFKDQAHKGGDAGKVHHMKCIIKP